ncbi:MAG: hypothetical protein IJU86_00905 [Firmicutes bacterium]|nr:hypothetical protein [Bacillota bacterium]
MEFVKSEKFLLPGGQRFYFKVSDLVKIINEKKAVVDNDPKAISIEYGVHSVYPLGGQGSRGSDGMYFSESRLTKLQYSDEVIDEAAQRDDVICFDTFALGVKDSNEPYNAPHDIYNVGFKITIGETESICLKSFVVKDKDGNYSLGLYYVGNVENWEKDVSNSEYAFPIYWDKEEKNRKINQEDLLRARVNLQIIDKESLNEISAAKINQSQAIVKCEYINPEDKNKGLLYFAESDEYLYKEENVSDGNKIGQSSKIKRVGKIFLLILIPILVFLLTFFVIKVAIAYAIIYAVLSIVVEFIVVFVRSTNHNKDNRIYDNLDSGEINNAEMKESIRDKIEKSEEYRKDIEILPWKYGTVRFNGYTGLANNYDGLHIMIFRYKQNENESNKIVCLQYCIYSLNSESHLEKSRAYEEEFPNPESIICLNYGEQLHLKVSDTLTFCDEEGNEINKEIPNAIIKLDDESFKTKTDRIIEDNIVAPLIK